MDAHVLVDYYNLPRKILSGGVSDVVNQMDHVVRSTYADITEVFFRLYGGWYNDSGLSNDGTHLVQDISKNFPRPVRSPAGGVCHTYCEIASSLMASRGDLFFATLRQRRGISLLLRTPLPTDCIDTRNCTAPGVIEWSRNGCPTAGCPVSCTDAFIGRQQKLVDILLCCDLLTVSSTGPRARVFLISEDDDFIPALLLAKSYGASVWHVRTKPTKPRLYDAMLLRSGVRVISI